jgi:hypothetical protein
MAGGHSSHSECYKALAAHPLWSCCDSGFRKQAECWYSKFSAGMVCGEMPQRANSSHGEWGPIEIPRCHPPLVNSWLKNLLRLPCPRCAAAAGVRCTGKLAVACPERCDAASRLRATPLTLPAGPTYAPGRNPTSNCRHRRHEHCRGRHGRAHGLPGLPCTCQCHIGAPKNSPAEALDRGSG